MCMCLPRGPHGEEQYTGQEGDTVIVGTGWPLTSSYAGRFSSMTASELGFSDSVTGSCGTPACTLVEMNA
jgi:hypothetical protein